MNSIVFIALCALLFTEALSIDCEKGFYSIPSPYSYSNFNMCYQCYELFTECTESLAIGTKVGNPRVVGYSYASNGDLVRYCVSIDNSIRLTYNKIDNTCQMECKEGCQECLIDYDYCQECIPGYVWNKDYTCTPITIGLQGASLAILAISLIFALIGCIVVIRAKKN